jgi:hypothetical protein
VLGERVAGDVEAEEFFSNLRRSAPASSGTLGRASSREAQAAAADASGCRTCSSAGALVVLVLLAHLDGALEHFRSCARFRAEGRESSRI